MIIIGERINSTRSSIQKALADNNIEYLMNEAHQQLASGAEFIDINTAASLKKEEENLTTLILNLQEKFNCGISIDSPDGKVVNSALKICKAKPFINSISGEKKRLSLLDNFIKQRDSYIIVLAMDDNGMPNDIGARVSIAENIISVASSKGIDKNNIFIDPLVKPVSTEPKQARFFLESVKILKEKGIRCIGGLSNVSFGLPKRNLLNAAFVKLAMNSGIDAAIIDPTQETIRGLLNGKGIPEDISSLAEDVLLGRDEYSMRYIKAFREGRLSKGDCPLLG